MYVCMHEERGSLGPLAPFTLFSHIQFVLVLRRFCPSSPCEGKRPKPSFKIRATLLLNELHTCCSSWLPFTYNSLPPSLKPACPHPMNIHNYSSPPPKLPKLLQQFPPISWFLSYHFCPFFSPKSSGRMLRKEEIYWSDALHRHRCMHESHC